LTKAIEVTQDTRLQERWTQEGFPEWFADNRCLEAEVLELLYEFPRFARDILNAPPSHTPSKVSMLKLLAELGRLMPTKTKEIVYADKDIQKMGREELAEFVQRNVKLLKGAANG
jgi:hypothetical protein